MIGERLYPLVQRRQKERAGKITGMLLELDNSELLDLLSNPKILAARVKDAVEVLDAHDAATKNANERAKAHRGGKRSPIGVN